MCGCYTKETDIMPQASKGILNHFSLISNQKISHPLLLLVIAASVIIIEGGPTTCPPTHFVKYSSSSGSSSKVEGCRLCPECPEGHELSIPCGSNITDNTNYDCVTCKETKTYSDSYGIENCKPCQQCGSRNVIQECTLTHNRKCGNETSTPTTASIESTPNITDSGEAKLSTPATTSIESTPNITDSGDAKLSTSATTSLESTATARQDPHLSTTAERSDSIMAYALAVPATIAIVLAIALIAILCRRRCKTSPELKNDLAVNFVQCETNRPSTEQISADDPVLNHDKPNTELIPADCLVSEMFRLHDHENQLMLDYVQKMLDPLETLTRKTWPRVGLLLHVKKEDLDLIETNYKAGTSPTVTLIEVLQCSPKEPSMIEFVQALHKCGRNEVANYICNWPWDNREQLGVAHQPA